MQNVSFAIVHNLRNNWFPVIRNLENHGYKVTGEIKEAKTTVVLSGTYHNPFAVNGRKILVAYQKEWGALWETLYKPILEEYYDEVLMLNEITIEELIKKVEGGNETSKSRGKD